VVGKGCRSFGFGSLGMRDSGSMFICKEIEMLGQNVEKGRLGMKDSGSIFYLWRDCRSRFLEG
jgi:hypothetical protein